MTLRELLQKNRSTYCYPAGVVTGAGELKDGKRVDAKLAEIWRIPVTLLDREVELNKQREVSDESD